MINQILPDTKTCIDILIQMSTVTPNSTSEPKLQFKLSTIKPAYLGHVCLRLIPDTFTTCLHGRRMTVNRQGLLIMLSRSVRCQRSSPYLIPTPPHPPRPGSNNPHGHPSEYSCGHSNSVPTKILSSTWHQHTSAHAQFAGKQTDLVHAVCRPSDSPTAVSVGTTVCRLTNEI